MGYTEEDWRKVQSENATKTEKKFINISMPDIVYVCPNCKEEMDYLFKYYHTCIKWWDCKYCGKNEEPKCHKCVRDDGKLVSDELVD